MKYFALIIASVLLLIYISGCGYSDKSKILENYKYEESISAPIARIPKNPGPWVKEGILCYGIVVVFNENKKPLRVKEFHAKVINIEPDKIRMRSLENIKMSQVKGCNKFCIKEGEDWDEADGDIFQTKEEAIKLIDTKYPGLRMK
jgi:hypothetical protein